MRSWNVIWGLMAEFCDDAGSKATAASSPSSGGIAGSDAEFASTHSCLAAKGSEQGRAQQEEGRDEFRESRRRHPGVESAIGALQSGNGQERCRDRSKVGY